ncbi:MAG: MarR family transcriptional regulator [Mucilaginibacter polytrichastri]|nr:MarR family transcriptional regulator [Mucilaginibacter polytrichastri]
MQIEEEIKTTKFENVFHKAVINLAFTNGWIQNKLRISLDNYGITQQQFNVLRILRGQYPRPSTVNLLKDRMLDKMSDASRITDRLVQKGLISRSVNEKDRRAVDILINDAGLELLARLDTEVQTTSIVQQNITEEEAEMLNRLLDKVRG